MGFLDKLFGGGPKEEPKKEASFNEPALPRQESQAASNVESIPDYLVSKDGNRIILHIPKSKVVKIGGRDSVRHIFREIYGGANPNWSEDFGTSYAVEFTPLPRINVDVAIEEMKRRINEKAKE